MDKYITGDHLKKILIIEDNRLTLSQLYDYLTSHSYSVIPCRTPSEAITHLEVLIPDLIILDVIMPEMDGYQLCRWVKSQPRLKLVPIVFLTVKNSVTDKVAGFRTGADDYITKPFEIEELLARIEVIIQRAEIFSRLSTRDDLTDAFNRRYFNERLDEEIYRARRTGDPFSIVILDIDGFKETNDSLGHNAGDYSLIQFVRLIKEQLRKNDILARFGGDEFVLLLPNTDSAKAASLMERIRTTLEEAVFNYNDNLLAANIKFTASAGIASYPEHAKTAEDLFAFADQALYRAKKDGKNAVKTAADL